jgi:hypothetical protein
VIIASLFKDQFTGVKGLDEQKLRRQYDML